MNNKKCSGCGAFLQTENKDASGYIRNSKYETASLCERCFKIKYYGVGSESNEHLDIEKIINDIDNSAAAVAYIIDILSITNESIKYLEYLNNKNIYIILTKFDLLPKGIKEGKIIKYFKENIKNYSNIMCVSAKTKYNIDNFFNLLLKNNIKKIYMVGLTNSGKSSFINAILESKKELPYVTTSSVPNTTIDYLNINLSGITIIDTPGFDIKSSIYNFLDIESIKKYVPKKELKVKTFQIKNNYSIIVGNILRIDYLSDNLNSLNFYMNNNIEYRKVKTVNNLLKTLPNKTYSVEEKSDILIEGLGFIKINKKGVVKVYSLTEELISIRKNMI